MRSIIVGDPHVQISNLDESAVLLGKVFAAAKENKVDSIIFLGDLFNNHDVIRARVMSFWIEWLKKAPTKVVALVGNHDMVGSKELEGKISALEGLSMIPNVKVVNQPEVIDGLGFIPYRNSSEEFLLACKDLSEKGVKTLFCHQTFDTARFENGFYAPHGVNPEDLPPGLTVIGGHIHAQQEIQYSTGKIWYCGSPRWLIASDANSEKGFWLVDFDKDTKQIFNSSEFIPPMLRFNIKEGSELPEFRRHNTDRIYVDLEGSSLWVKDTRKNLPDGVKVSTKLTDYVKKRRHLSTERGIVDFVGDNYTPSLVSKDELKVFLQEKFG